MDLVVRISWSHVHNDIMSAPLHASSCICCAWYHRLLRRTSRHSWSMFLALASRRISTLCVRCYWLPVPLSVCLFFFLLLLNTCNCRKCYDEYGTLSAQSGILPGECRRLWHFGTNAVFALVHNATACSRFVYFTVMRNAPVCCEQIRRSSSAHTAWRATPRQAHTHRTHHAPRTHVPVHAHLHPACRM